MAVGWCRRLMKEQRRCMRSIKPGMGGGSASANAQLDENATERPAVARKAPAGAKDHLRGTVLPRVHNGRLHLVHRVEGSAAKIDELRARVRA